MYLLKEKVMKEFKHAISWWSISKKELAGITSTDLQQGLSEPAVKTNRVTFGSNSFAESKPTKIIDLIFEGIKEPMMLVLLSIAVLSFVFGNIGQSLTMIFVVMAYISVELINKFRTDRSMMRLKALASPTTKVLREGTVHEIPTQDVVVGDILILSSGTLVAADARLLTSYGLMVNEASLTGESLSVEKTSDSSVDQHASLGQRVNCVFSGTPIVNGQGTAIAFAVGQQSEFGKIAHQVLGAHQEKTVLQELMTNLAKVLAIFAMVASALIPAIGFWRGFGLQEMVLTWLSLTFLMVPGQPPIIITMALAIAAFALAKKNIIVKRLRGVEILGQVTAIVSDKTGTMTENSMVVETFFLADGNQTKRLPLDIQERVILALPDYCSDPTDQAVFEMVSMPKRVSQIGFRDFSAKKPWRDSVYSKDGAMLHAIAGSPELLVSQAMLSSEHRKQLIDIIKHEAYRGKRVVAYAWSENKKHEPMEVLENIHLSALAILSDPVRPGVRHAIETLKNAGITTFMVTGDHQETAQTIAQEVGISGPVISGDHLETMNDTHVAQELARSHVLARIDPGQKVRLVTILQKQGDVVAVIGDGVNDAPALKAAHVGIAMGHIGTDLAKEISDLILTDDNYVHIPDAIAYARRALDNFQKGLTYYLSAKSILLIIFLVPLIFGIPFPFVPIQIILIELLMDLASSTIFVTEQAEPDVMKKSAPNMKKFLGRSLIAHITKNSIGLSMAILFVYMRAYKTYDITTAQTAALVSWLLGHILLALHLKQEKIPLIVQGLFSNYFGIFWLVGMVLLSLSITCLPFLYPYVQTTHLSLALWVEILIAISLATWWIEVKKIIRRIR